MSTRPKELVAVAPRQPVLREYQEEPLKPNHVRIRSTFSAVKHGTELGLYRGTDPCSTSHFDPELKLFLPGGDKGYAGFPLRLGNMTVGKIIEVGSQVKRFKVGDRVFGWLPIRETHTVPESAIQKAPEGMSPEAIVCLDPAEFALGAVRDANIRLGERVILFGLGAIGFMVLQMAKLSGAELVMAVDPLENRRRLALKHKADLVLDPNKEDIAVKIRAVTDKKGADVAIESSGFYQALHEAIRSVCFGGLVVSLAAYKGEVKGLRLGEEWHINRITMKSSRSISDPNRDHPMWNSARIKEVAFRLLREGKLSTEGLVSPVVPFEKSVEAYQDIDNNPGGSIKLGIAYPDN